MTVLIQGRPPAVFDPPAQAVQTSPLIPGSLALEDVEPGTADGLMMLASPGVLERRYDLALAMRAVRPGGWLDVMAPKTRGGSRLKAELEAIGLTVAESAKAHHRRCQATRPDNVNDAALEAAIVTGGPRRDAASGLQTQPGIFAWDRVDPGTALLLQTLSDLSGAGADLGCGLGLLSLKVLQGPAVTHLQLIDRDRRAVAAARANVGDDRARFDWADVLTLKTSGDLDFVVSNPPFHDGGSEDRQVGQGFVRQAAAMLKRGGVLWLVANRHLPYEAVLDEAFKRVDRVAEDGGYKVFRAVK